MLWLTIFTALALTWSGLAQAKSPPIPASAPNPVRFASRAPLICVGPQDSTRRLIYLHGLDTEDPSEHEVRIRTGLAATADKLKARLAIVRAWDKCKGKLCWNYREPKDLKKTWADIQAGAEDCFPPDRRRKPAKAKPQPLQDVVLVGFSNGGYLAGALYKQCLAPDLGLIVAIGAGGRVKGSETDLKDCSALRMLIGRRDQAHAASLIFAKALAHRGGDAMAIEFDGGHDVPQDELGRLLLEHWRLAEQRRRGPLPPPKARPKKSSK